MVGGRPNGRSQSWDPGPPWCFFFLVITVALSWVTQRPLDLFISFISHHQQHASAE